MDFLRLNGIYGVCRSAGTLELLCAVKVVVRKQIDV